MDDHHAPSLFIHGWLWSVVTYRLLHTLELFCSDLHLAVDELQYLLSGLRLLTIQNCDRNAVEAHRNALPLDVIREISFISLANIS